MTILTLIYSLAALLIGFLLGITTEIVVTIPHIKRLVNRNNLVEMENAALTDEKRQKQSRPSAEVFEIPAEEVDYDVDYSQDW